MNEMEPLREINECEELVSRLASPAKEGVSPRRRRIAGWLSTILRWTVWTYCLLICAVWALLWCCGDRWWPATVVTFAPRWLAGLPLPVLVPAAAVFRRRLLVPLAAAVAVLVVPIMGLCVPIRFGAPPDGPRLRVLSCNIHGDAVDARRLLAVVNDSQVDLVALQECWGDTVFHWPAGWQVRRQGQLLVASRYPVLDVRHHVCRHPPGPWPPVNALSCLVETPHGRIRFCCIHLQSPHEGLSEVLDRRTIVSSSRSGELEAEIEQRQHESEDLRRRIEPYVEPTILAGDFNMPTDSAIYRLHWSQWTNAFSVSGRGFGYTKWTPVGPICYGARIDHILTDRAWQPSRCWVGPDVGSDHLPLLADLHTDGQTSKPRAETE